MTAVDVALATHDEASSGASPPSSTSACRTTPADPSRLPRSAPTPPAGATSSASARAAALASDETVAAYLAALANGGAKADTIAFSARQIAMARQNVSMAAFRSARPAYAGFRGRNLRWRGSPLPADPSA